MMTQDELKSFANYDPLTGVMTRTKKTSQNSKAVGSEIGRLVFHKNKNLSYKAMSYKNKTYYLHRVVWLYMTGNWPDNHIDHIDGDGTNNSWANLRTATNTINMRNCKIKKNNKSGCSGVYWNKNLGKWHASIGSGSRHVHLGFFDILEQAIMARRKAEREHGYHPNHGRAA
jgi:hypothetical protein